MNPSAGWAGKGEGLFERLEVMDDREPRSGPFNMAADEALLARLGSVPLLRMYRWAAPMVSFGYFEGVAPVRAAYPDVALVRRWTGGGVVEHGADFTYSLLVPRGHPLARQRVAESYAAIHGALALALEQAGCRTASSAEADSPGASRSRACFLNPVRYDLMRGGRKVAGAAQRRTRQGLLHQGSVQGAELVAGEPFADRLASALPGCFCGGAVWRNLHADEAAAARTLAAERYGTEAWTARC